ncbi:TolC family outer membrane protein [Pseudodesulfovibrio piezophilus]|uniref:Type I secretion outer membrane protein, TolC family n=1 Tax=Pseudodesulfovibrio piezophilus (strain DSM 21447 / JCM 15486 / C1TLV30) TaxID=1322246 RepID=M1WKR5_PSEP2|nr:TolC family outer membrane protein [Pseudodesulfovibrio piezophilus]CCH50061.1 Type I secretion outer membrane protein, TolC family [Pseudodesulfovibrio piezophilus C1TLV30]
MKRFIFAALCALVITTPALADVDGTTSVKESVIAAVKHHPQIKSLLYNREALSRNLAASLGRFFPSLNLSSDIGYQRYDSATTRANSINNQFRSTSDTTVSLTQNVFDGMDRYNEYQGSEARLDSAKFRLIDNVESVGLDAIRAHIDIVRERKLMELAKVNIAAHQDVLGSIVERVEGGAGSKADEMQARGRVARAETTLITYKGSLATAESEYYRITGLTPTVLDDATFSPDFIPAAFSDVLEKTLDNNPKIKTYKAEVDVSERDKGRTESDMLPNVDVQLSSRHTDHLDGSETHLRDDRAMLAVSWNLFNGGTDYNEIKEADARVNEAKADLENIIDDLTRQVKTAWSDYETSIETIEKHTEALQYSMESRDMYLMQFNVGQRSLLDVLDSINEVFSNSVLLETAKSNRTFSLYKFLALEGELVKTLEVADTTYDTLPQ